MANPVQRPAPVRYSKHIASLDGLRGVAILLVFLHHWYPRRPGDPVSLLASAGWCGVDLFFVLSGFLITGILYNTLGEPTYFRTFFARRSLRLFPAYFFMMFFFLMLAKPLKIHFTWMQLPFFFYGANIVDALNLTPIVSPYLRFSHLWSLALEEQFYLLWAPLVFLLRTRSGLIKACVWGIAIAILLRCITVFFTGGLYFAAVYRLLPMRMDALLCGALIALYLRGDSPRLTSGVRRGLLCCGLLFAGLGALLSRSFSATHPPVMTFGFLGNEMVSMAVIASALIPGTFVDRVGNLRPLRLLGRYSYSFYLWHSIPSYLGNHFLGWCKHAVRPHVLAIPFAILVLFAFDLLMAITSYHLIELPFLRLKQYFRYRGKDRPLVETTLHEPGPISP